MKQKKPTDEECIERLQAAADALAQDGASLFDTVMAFGDVALTLAQRDPGYAHAQLDIVANAFSACAAAARVQQEKLAGKK